MAAHHRPAARGDVAFQAVDLHQLGGVARGRAAVDEQADGPLGLTREPGRLGHLPQQAGAPLDVARQPRGSVKRGGGGRVRAAMPAAGARLLERCRCGFVCADRRSGEMPGAPVDIAVGQDGGERAMGLAPLLGRGVRIHGRAHEWMAKLDRPPAQREQPRGLGRGERCEVNVDRGRGALEHRQLAAVTAGGEDQRSPRSLIECADPSQERARHVGRHEHRRVRGRERQVVGVSGELEQRKRVAGRRTMESVGRVGRQAGQQDRRFVAGQAAESHGGQVGAVEQRRLSFANGDQDRDRIGE